jgi:hypothetical protein
MRRRSERRRRRRRRGVRGILMMKVRGLVEKRG